MPIAIAIVLLLAVGGATAAKLITGKEIANHTITGQDIKRGSIPLSALKGKPAGTPGAQGERGSKGDAGVVGAEGPIGPSPVSWVGTLTGPIAASIAPSTSIEFIGKPAEVFVASGYRGAAEATLAIGTEGATIDDRSKFALAICVDQGGGPEPIEEEAGKFGISPELPSGRRVAVTVSTGFFVSGEEEELFAVELGPCVLNETASALDNNDRSTGYVLASSRGS